MYRSARKEAAGWSVYHLMLDKYGLNPLRSSWIIAPPKCDLLKITLRHYSIAESLSPSTISFHATYLILLPYFSPFRRVTMFFQPGWLVAFV